MLVARIRLRPGCSQKTEHDAPSAISPENKKLHYYRDAVNNAGLIDFYFPCAAR